MSNGFGAIVAAGIVGAVTWAISKSMQTETPPETKVVYERKPSQSGIKGALFNILGNALDNIDLDGPVRKTTTPVQTPTQTFTPGYTPKQPRPVATGSGGLRGLMDLIGGVEAPKGYDQVWGGIRAGDQPPKPLTSMTVDEVLAWQDSIDPKYNSEAAGRYQIMEDTLRGLKGQGKVRGSERFSRETQDRLAVTLMEGRGLKSFQAGKISATQFANNLSQEWASLPATTFDKKGRRASGQSYYAGDGLNRSHVSIHQVMEKVRGLF